MGSKEVGLLLTVVMLVHTFDCGNCNRQQIGKVVSFKSNAVTRVEDSEIARHRDSRSVHRSQRSVLSSVDMQTAVDTHNNCRRLVGAADEEIMTWDDYLASLANDWSNNCKWEYGQLYRDSTRPYSFIGQNLYAISGVSFLNVTSAILDWYNERTYFNYDTLACQQGKQCGHYTQIVWATSRALGCAIANCTPLDLVNTTMTSSALFLVCNYGPAGNVVGQKPFKIGTGCSQCAGGSWWCNSGLCDLCNATCQNSGSLNSATCSCSCAPGWTGSDCSATTTRTTTKPTTTQTSQSTITATTQSTPAQSTTTGTTQPTTTSRTKPIATKPTTDKFPVLRSVAPNRGPVAGGTRVIFEGQRLNETISEVYFGNAVSGIITSSTYSSLTVYSPVGQQTGSVSIDLTFNRNTVTTNLTFEYRPNPSIDLLQVAPIQLTSGGSLLTVVGTSLDSVVNPQVNVTVVLLQPASCNRCRRATNSTQLSTTNSYIGDCMSESSGNMTCVLPDLHLPDNFTSKLEDHRQNNFSIMESGSVAKLYGPDGSEAVIYLGIILDGYDKYKNVSDPTSGLQDQAILNFVPPPVINSSTELITFDPRTDDEIQIQGRSLLDGCSYGVVCEVLVGDGQCRITKVTDNVITCLPQKEKPHQSTNDSFCRPTQPNSMIIEIHIGLKHYYYKCLDYYFPDQDLIIGLTVGLGVPALVVIFVALFCCIRKLRSREKLPPSGGQTPLTTYPQNPNNPFTRVQNLELILRDNEANDYISNTGLSNENCHRNQTDIDAACTRTDKRKTMYPPPLSKAHKYNQYLSNINDDRAECSAHDNRSGFTNGVGGLESHSKQSHFPQSSGRNLENYDYNLGQISDEFEYNATYANFGEH